MSLTIRVIDRLFERLNTVYGRDFISMWEGQDMNTVKVSWAYTLGGYDGKYEPVAWALDHLPDRPPNAIQFRNLCLQAPAFSRAPLPVMIETDVVAEPVDADLARSIVAKLKAPLPPEPHGMKQWAHVLKARHDGGEKLNPNQVRCYKNALCLHAGGAQL